jgi:diguanylate cyclase (GGDEF)-like protein
VSAKLSPLNGQSIGINGSATPSWLVDLLPDVLDSMPTSVMLVQPLGSAGLFCSYANQTLAAQFGLKVSDIVGESLTSLPQFCALSNFSSAIRKCLSTAQAQTLDLATGFGPLQRHFLVQMQKLADQPALSEQVMITIADRTQERLTEKHVYLTARQDLLTGLPNRLALTEYIEELLADSAHEVGLLIINIDRFQQINESLGHIAGDELLISLARRFRDCVRKTDLVVRMSSDEFAIIIPDLTYPELVTEYAATVHESLQQRFVISGNEIFSSGCIGLTTTHASNRHVEDLIRDADFAMHQAKQDGRSTTRVYHPASHSRVKNLFHLEADLRKAIEREELHLVFQPLVHLDDYRLAGFEALARWNHPEKGFISPADFIPIAEDSGLIIPLGRWAMEAACLQMQTWRDTFGSTAESLMMGVNLSSVQLAKDDMLGVVKGVFDRTGLPAHNLKIELTESALVNNPENVSTILHQMKALDLSIALDDFGTGYSSLSYLQKFPIDILKIDRSFVAKMLVNEEHRKIVVAIMSLAQSLGMTVVAEGIEEEAQAFALEKLGCQFGQGFVFAKPLDVATASRAIETGRMSPIPIVAK